MIWLTCYIAIIYAANWAIGEFGFVNVGFGLTAPAGVFFAGLAFTFRDFTHEAIGRRGCLAAIAAGAALSYLLGDGRIALASGAAFLLSELADLAVYDPLRRRNWLAAVGLSNSVGLVLDSAIFLALAFGSLTFIWGQILGKAYMTAIAVVFLWPRRLRTTPAL